MTHSYIYSINTPSINQLASSRLAITRKAVNHKCTFSFGVRLPISSVGKTLCDQHFFLFPTLSVTRLSLAGRRGV